MHRLLQQQHYFLRIIRLYCTVDRTFIKKFWVYEYLLFFFHTTVICVSRCPFWGGAVLFHSSQYTLPSISVSLCSLLCSEVGSKDEFMATQTAECTIVGKPSANTGDGRPRHVLFLLVLLERSQAFLEV